MQIRSFHSSDEAAVIEIWRRCDLLRPWNDPAKDIRRKVASRPDLFLVAVDNDQVIGTIMAGYDGHRGWLNYLAVLPIRQGHGVGRALVAEAERLLRLEGCPKINLQVRTINRGAIDFYRRLGFDIDDAVCMGKRLEND